MREKVFPNGGSNTHGGNGSGSYSQGSKLGLIKKHPPPPRTGRSCNIWPAGFPNCYGPVIALCPNSASSDGDVGCD